MVSSSAEASIQFDSKFYIYYRFEVNTALKFALYQIKGDQGDTLAEKQPPPTLYEQQRVSFGVRPLGIPDDGLLAESISFISFLCTN